MAHALFDLVVIGSGPAGQKAALFAAKLGKRVALIDKKTRVGGVCIHTGTIPSKAIREAVLHLAGLNQRELYGHDYAVKNDITMDDLLLRAQHVVRCETEVVRSQMRRNGIHLLYGTARFEDPHTLVLDDGDEVQHIRSERILVAVGTEPARPANVPFTPGRVIDSNEILQLRQLPKTLTIVGGGVIGVEYACMLACVGVRVTLVEGRGRLLEFLDEEITESLQYRLREMSVRLRMNEKVEKIEVLDAVPARRADDPPVIAERGSGVVATLCSGKVIRSDALLYCVGRQGATDSLDLSNAGLSADERGRIKVDEHFQTEVPHIYAAGDVIGFPSLAATSMEQGRRAARHMFAAEADGFDGAMSSGLETELNTAAEVFPFGIYTIPEISMVGATEKQLTEQNVPYEVGISRYREIARAQLAGDTHGMIKLLFHAVSRRLLGIHAIGTGATELIHIGQVALAAGFPVDFFAEAVFNYPTLAECYKVAALDGLNRLRPHGVRAGVGAEVKPTPVMEPVDRQAA